MVNFVILIAVAFLLLKKSHIYRYIRSFYIIPLLWIGYIVYNSFFRVHDYNYSHTCSSNSFELSNHDNLLYLVFSLYQYFGSCTNSIIVHTIIGDIIGSLLICQSILYIDSLTSINYKSAKKSLTDNLFRLAKSIPFIKSEIDKEMKKNEHKLEEDLKPKSRSISTSSYILPENGIPSSQILQLMSCATKSEDVIWENGRISGAVYFGKHDHIKLLNDAFSMYSISNPLHSDIWPSLMKFESEIISMTSNLVKGKLNDEEVCGATTSGGTESIILAIKSHRDYYRDNYNITHPEMVVGVSAHAAVDKACEMLNIKLIKVDLDPITFKINLNEMENQIGPNTIMLYGSAPCYPQGVIDPIVEMGRLAVKYNIGLHVDCCLGGFYLPFAKMLKYDIPDFDFSVPGVSSMSLDTHKYGYALKGSSVVLYRNKSLRHSQYFCYSDWTGGMYATPTIAGSRSGGLIAQCWASMMALGLNGYLKHTKEIYEVTHAIAEGVEKIEGIKLLGGRPNAMIVCFTSTGNLNIYSIGDKMTKKGWSLNSLQNPACIHICCTVAHVGRDKEFVKDLKDSVQEILNNPNEKVSGNAAIYGMTSALPPGPVNELLKVYNDIVLKV